MCFVVVGRGFIALFGQHAKSNIKCALINVYAACNLNDKVALWEDLTNIKKYTSKYEVMFVWRF